MISVGWNEKFKIFIHLFAPLVSWKKRKVEKDKNIATEKMKILKIIRFFKLNFERRHIKMKPKKQKTICFLNNRSYFSSILVDALKTPNTPININTNTERPINLSRSEKRFTLNLL